MADVTFVLIAVERDDERQWVLGATSWLCEFKMMSQPPSAEADQGQKFRYRPKCSSGIILLGRTYAPKTIYVSKQSVSSVESLDDAGGFSKHQAC